MKDYARAQVDARRERVREEWGRAAVNPDDDAIHDLRVAIRRLSQAYRVFGPLVPGKEAKRARKDLRPVRKLAGDVRDCDIAIELLREAGLPDESKVIADLANRRRKRMDKLARRLARGVPV